MIREVLVEAQELAWLPWAVSYFFFIGIAISGVFSAACIRYLSKRHDIYHELLTVSIALSAAIVAPIALTADLHQPGRAWHFYHTFAPWSWMAWGSLFLPLFTVSVVGYFLFLLRQIAEQEHLPKWLRPLLWGKVNDGFFGKIFCLLSVMSAGLILLYTTMEIYVVAARPLWHQTLLSPLLLFSVLPAAALFSAFMIRFALHHEPPEILTRIALVSALALVLVLVYMALAHPRPLGILWQRSHTLLWSAASLSALIVLLLIPKQNLLLDGIRTLIAMLLAACIRWVLLIEVQTLPKYSALPNRYHFRWDADGGMGMVAMLGLWLLVGVILWQLLVYVLQEKMGGDYHG